MRRRRFPHASWTIGQVFGLKEDAVHVTSPFCRRRLWVKDAVAAPHPGGGGGAKLAGKPVRMALSREGVFRIVGGRTLTEQRVAIGAQDDGTFDAVIHTGISPMTNHNNQPEAFIMGTKSGYASMSFKLEVDTVAMDMVANTFMRRAWRVGGHLRAGVRHRRTGPRDGHGPH